MKKLIICFCMFVSFGAHAGVGDIDKRVYVDWSQPPYTKIVYFYPQEYATCTAQYVARDIILTARHCITTNKEFDQYKLIGKKFDIKLHDERKTQVTLEQYGHDNRTDDWALLRVTDSAFYSNDFFNVGNKTEYINIENAGFGYMRILSDTEIKQIKEIFKSVAAEYRINQLNFNELLDKSHTVMQQRGIPFLSDSIDDITSEEDYKTKKWEFRLKADKTCKLVRSNLKQNILQKFAGTYDDTFRATCDNMGGNSGGPYFSGGNLYGIVSKGLDSFDDKYARTFGVKNQLYYKQLQKMKSSSPIVSPEPETVETTESQIQRQETELQQTADTLVSQSQNIDDMTDADFLKFLGQTTEYSVLKDNLEKAKARETSLANRTLGAVAIGAAGYGGMMALQGMAEQSADENAEQSMRAYLETFRCDYGQGKNHRGGEVGIEIPGGNALTVIYQEYISLATEIHRNKELLGMKPEIESEVLTDSATGGLYDNAAMGKTGGGFISVANALQNPDGKDAVAWNEQKSDTKSKVNTGTLVGGAGVLGGAVGNLIINNDKDKEK